MDNTNTKMTGQEGYEYTRNSQRLLDDRLKEVKSYYCREDYVRKLHEVIAADDTDRKFRKAELETMCRARDIDMDKLMEDSRLLDQIPTKEEMKQELLSLIYEIYKNSHSPEEYMERLVYRLVPDSAGEPVRLVILKQFVRGAGFSCAAIPTEAILDWVRNKMSDADRLTYDNPLKPERDRLSLAVGYLDDSIFLELFLEHKRELDALEILKCINHTLSRFTSKGAAWQGQGGLMLSYLSEEAFDEYVNPETPDEKKGELYREAVFAWQKDQMLSYLSKEAFDEYVNPKTPADKKEGLYQEAVHDWQMQELSEEDAAAYEAWQTSQAECHTLFRPVIRSFALRGMSEKKREMYERPTDRQGKPVSKEEREKVLKNALSRMDALDLFDNAGALAGGKGSLRPPGAAWMLDLSLSEELLGELKELCAEVGWTETIGAGTETTGTGVGIIGAGTETTGVSTEATDAKTDTLGTKAGGSICGRLQWLEEQLEQQEEDWWRQPKATKNECTAPEPERDIGSRREWVDDFVTRLEEECKEQFKHFKYRKSRKKTKPGDVGVARVFDFYRQLKDEKQKEKNDQYDKKWVLLRWCDAFAKGIFRIDNQGEKRRWLYYFAYMFGLTVTMHETEPKGREPGRYGYDPDTNLVKNLFEDYYGDNLIRFLRPEFNQNNALRLYENELTGEGVDYKSYIEVTYLYFLYHKKLTFAPGSRIVQENHGEIKTDSEMSLTPGMRIDLAEKVIREYEDRVPGYAGSHSAAKRPPSDAKWKQPDGGRTQSDDKRAKDTEAYRMLCCDKNAGLMQCKPDELVDFLLRNYELPQQGDNSGKSTRDTEKIAPGSTEYANEAQGGTQGGKIAIRPTEYKAGKLLEESIGYYQKDFGNYGGGADQADENEEEEWRPFDWDRLGDQLKLLYAEDDKDNQDVRDDKYHFRRLIDILVGRMGEVHLVWKTKKGEKRLVPRYGKRMTRTKLIAVDTSYYAVLKYMDKKQGAYDDLTFPGLYTDFSDVVNVDLRAARYQTFQAKNIEDVFVLVWLFLYLTENVWND